MCLVESVAHIPFNLKGKSANPFLVARGAAAAAASDDVLCMLSSTF